MVQDSDQNIGQARVAVVGVGGGGSNAVNRMYKNMYTASKSNYAIKNKNCPWSNWDRRNGVEEMG